MVQQNEASECGLACLAMVARFHGHDIDLSALRRRFSVSSRGSSLKQLNEIAERLDLQPRAVRIELEQIRHLETPCILHWDLNHFVVLKRVKKKTVEIHDPARGYAILSHQELSRHFTGIALCFSPSSDLKPVSMRRRISWSRLIGKVRGLKQALGQIVLLALALEVFTLAAPLAMQGVIDHVLVGANLDLLTLLGIGFLSLVIFQAMTMAMRGWVVAGLGASMNAQWFNNLYTHLLSLPLNFFQKRHVGDVISRFHSLKGIQNTLTGSFVEALLDGLTVVFVLFVLALYNLQLTLLVVSAFSLYLAARWIAFKRLRLLNEEKLVHTARQESSLVESIRGAQTIKLANRQGERRARMENVTIEVANRDAVINRVHASFAALATLIFGGQRVLLIWIGAWMTLGGGMTVGMLVVFVAYAEMFSSRASALVDRLVDLRMLGLHGERVADISLEPAETNMRTGYLGPTPEPVIEVENLAFRYGDDDPWVIRHCSFKIQSAESIVITGSSGCGKTTLAKLILGLLKPSSGVVRIGGIAIEQLGLESYRDMCAAVMQEDSLFAGSLADNISFFDGAADFGRIEQAARAACIHDDITAMAMGYETLVGDMGSSLSGGQKQRILLARALYRRPRILVLDEATSHLDVDTEKQINRHIAELNMTRIVIAHRPDTIASAERVLAMANGEVSDRDRITRAPIDASRVQQGHHALL